VHFRRTAILVTLCVACAASKEVVRPAPAAANAPESVPEAAAGEPSLSPEATFHFVRASLLLERGDAAGASEAVREAMIFDHRSALLNALLSTALLRTGDHAGALQAAERAVQLNGKSVEAHAARSAALWEAGRPQDAEPALRLVLQPAPERPVEAARLMELLIRRNDVDGARKVSHAHVTASADSDEALAVLPHVCRKLAAWECAALALEDAVKKAPASAELCRMRAGVLQTRGRFAAAADAWSICVALEPGDEAAEAALISSLAASGQTGVLRARLRSMLTGGSVDLARVLAAGEALLDSHDVDNARWLAQQAQPAWHAHVELRGLEGRALALAGECTRALPLLELVPVTAGSGVAVMEARAGCLLRRHQAADAVPILQKAVGQRAEATALHNLLCRALKDLGRPKDAAAVAAALGESGHLMTRARCLLAAGDGAGGRQLLARRLADAPDDRDLLFLQSLLLWDADQKAEALKSARLLLSSHPEDARTMNFLAYALLRTGGNAAEALRLAQRALEKDPSSAEVLDTVGEALVASGDAARGVESLQEAARRLSHDPEVLMHLGDALKASGKSAQARDVWQRAAALLPLDPHVESALKSRVGGP